MSKYSDKVKRRAEAAAAAEASEKTARNRPATSKSRGAEDGCLWRFEDKESEKESNETDCEMIRTDKPVLDACCGSRMFWKDRKNPNVVFVDNRVVEDREIWRSRDGASRRVLNVRPDVVADFTALPFADETFWHVVFDPPHLFNVGKSSWMREKYGALDRETWPDTIKRGFDECWRVLRTNGTLIFKWSEHDIKVGTVLAVIGRPPLYGHITGKGHNTLWAAFVKMKNAD